MKKNLFLWLVAAVVMMTSCQKDAEGVDNSSAAALLGDWKFTGMKMKTNTDFTMTVDNQSHNYIIGMNYGCPSTTSGGIYRFTSDKMTAVNVVYKPEGAVALKYYVNGSLQTDETLDMESDLTKINGSSNYKAVGTDSIYCPGGAIMNVTDPSYGMSGRDVTTIPAGFKYKIEGSKLTIYLKMATSVDLGQSGMKYKVDWDGEYWMEKQ